MALSNIWKEPRREITETVVGLAVVGVLATPGAWIGSAIRASDPTTSWAVAIFFGVMIMFCALFCGVCVLAGIHLIGEIACEALEDRGLRLRPKRRW